MDVGRGRRGVDGRGLGEGEEVGWEDSDSGAVTVYR